MLFWCTQVETVNCSTCKYPKPSENGSLWSFRHFKNGGPASTPDFRVICKTPRSNSARLAAFDCAFHPPPAPAAPTNTKDRGASSHSPFHILLFFLVMFTISGMALRVVFIKFPKNKAPQLARHIRKKNNPKATRRSAISAHHQQERELKVGSLHQSEERGTETTVANLVTGCSFLLGCKPQKCLKDQ